MEPRVELRLRAASTAPALARALVSTEFAHLSSSRCEIAALLTSELVSNAVRHTGMSASEDIVLRLRDGDGVRVEVVDAGPGWVERTPAHPDENGGWGLVFVDRLASSWGAQAEGGRHMVWFELDNAAGG